MAIIHYVFHVFMPKNYLKNPVSILPIEHLVIKEDLSYEEVPIDRLDCNVMKLRNKEVTFVNLLWNNHLIKGETREAEVDIKSRYPCLFPLTTRHD